MCGDKETQSTFCGQITDDDAEGPPPFIYFSRFRCKDEPDRVDREPVIFGVLGQKVCCCWWW